MILNNEMFKRKENEDIVKVIAWEISEALRKKGYDNENDVTLAAYLLYKVSQYKNPTKEVFANAIQEVKEKRKYAESYFLQDDVCESLLPLAERYTTEQFALASVLAIDTFEFRGAVKTPESIIKLASRILNINENERVADICCGCGSYLISSAMKQSSAVYSGYEINTKNCMTAGIRSEFMEADIDIRQCDVFNLATKIGKFDKIFANYPFKQRLKNLDTESPYLEKLFEKHPEFSKITSSDWIFNMLLCDLLKKGGKAIGIMTNGSTWNSIDVPVRKYFVEHGMIECVISLPEKMFSSINIPTTLIVFSKNHNGVRMIDATEFFQKGRRQNEFSENDISTIMEALQGDSEYSKFISIELLREREYNLNLRSYGDETTSFENGVPFESVIKRITRGAPCTASQLDQMVSEEVTNMQYLMLANIQDGMIDDNLPYLSCIEPKYEKYCLKDNALILSKNGFPYKVAIASVEEGKKIMANGNLYIIELNSDRANPYYVKAFLESEPGIKALRNITVGSTILNIGIDKLKKMEIPLPELEEQNRIAEKYKKALEEISEMKFKLEKAVENLKHIFNEN